MANALYAKYKEAMLSGTLDLATANIKCMLVTTSYTPNLASDQFVGNGTAPIPSGAIVARSGNLASVTVALGVFNAAAITLTGVSGSAAAYIVIYVDSGSDATSSLICIIDTATGLPITPNGGDITIAWDTGTNKIFHL